MAPRNRVMRGSKLRIDTAGDGYEVSTRGSPPMRFDRLNMTLGRDVNVNFKPGGTVHLTGSKFDVHRSGPNTAVITSDDESMSGGMGLSL